MPDQQIQKGTTYANGNSVDATNLNAHVDNAILLPGAITAQPALASVSLSDSLLVKQGAGLGQATFTQVKQAFGLNADYLKVDGSNGLTTGQLNLYATTQVSALNAVSLAHLNANFLKNSSPLQTLTGSLALTDYLTASNSIRAGTTSEAVNLTTTGISFLTTNQIMLLKQDPVNALEAAPKQYVDATAPRCKAQFNGRYTSTTVLTGTYNATTTFVTFTTSQPHGFLVGHKFQAELTKVSGGAAPLITTLFQVSSVTDVNTFVGIPAITPVASTGNITAIRKCVINNQSGTNLITSIVYLGASGAAAYAVNLTSDVDINKMCPIVTSSGLNAPETYVASTVFGYLIALDYLESGGKQVPRNNTHNGNVGLTNSFVFTSFNPIPTSYDVGARSSIVIY